MKNIFLSSIFFTAILFGCKEEKGHSHNEGSHGHGLEPVSHTIWTKNTELFVEYKPLIVGQTSHFAAHFSELQNFKAIAEGEVTVSLICNKNGIKHSVNAPSSPGIFRLALQPKETGVCQLIFDIKTNEFEDRIVIDDVSVSSDEEEAISNIKENDIGEEIVYLKEQAWKVDFANEAATTGPFSEIIKTTGEIKSAQGDEVVITAKSNGIITFSDKKTQIGSEISKEEILLTISGNGLTEANINTKYAEAKANFEKSKTDFKRGEELIKDNIISQKDFQDLKLKFEKAELAFSTISSNYSKSGQSIYPQITGFIKNLLVSEGEYVEMGKPLAVIAQNKRLLLTAEVPQIHFSKLNSILSANFKTAYNNNVYCTDSLNGKLISYGKNTNNNSHYIPLNFEIDNKGELISGSYIEVLLKTTSTRNCLTIPVSSLLEEQGNYFAYVQTSGEGFQKRELNLGANDGQRVVVKSGIMENERVVTQGAYQIKLATMSGKMPAHGHEH